LERRFSRAAIFVAGAFCFPASPLSAMLAGANAAVLGDEIIQYQTATLLSGSRWRLSGLLRGRFGTPITGHAVGDRFVVLSAEGLYRVTTLLNAVGAESLFRCVTFGSSPADAAEQAFTHTAASQKPLAPVHLGIGSNGDGYLAHWVRRTRIGGAWRDSADVPMGEFSEQYRVRVLDGATVVEEVTTTETQAELGVESSPPDYSGMTLEVAQISGTVGAGFAARITIP
jgi:hypothetical protein